VSLRGEGKLDLADRRHERRGDDHVDAGDGHQALDLRPLERLGGDRALDRLDLEVEELDLAQRRVDGLALLCGEAKLGEPAPTLGSKGLCERGAAHQAAHQGGVDLVLRPGPRADQLGAASDPSAHHAGPLVRHPDPIELARGEQPREGAGVEPISLRPRTADPGVGRGDDDHLRDVGLDDALDRPGVAGTSSATRSAGSRL
jgi:hypothetical protein